MTTLTHLECTRCGRRHEAGQIWNLCQCGGPLAARYDLERAAQSWNRDWVNNGPTNIWRYAPVLPVSKPAAMISLGEGMTPLVRLSRLGPQLGATELWLKDEGLNPTGSFEARGFACAVGMAVELGIRRVAVTSSGHAASALAAYAAAAGIEAQVGVPPGVPQANYLECRAFGARLAAPGAGCEDWFEMSAWAEPYRLEGQKTIGYELAEQFRWSLPGAVLCPAGEGMGLFGMGKAFAEMEALGWTAGRRPKMIAVRMEADRQAVRAAETLGEALLREALRASGGGAVDVSYEEALDAALELAAREGVFAAPEGGACVAAIPKLLTSGVLAPDERMVICNTGAGLKYLEAYSTRFPRAAAGEQDKLGGLITPR